MNTSIIIGIILIVYIGVLLPYRIYKTKYQSFVFHLRNLILFIGGIITYWTYQTQYQVHFFTYLILGILDILGLLIFVWAIVVSIDLFKKEKRLSNFRLTFLGLPFIIINVILAVQINKTFNKPTLLKVYYDDVDNWDDIEIDFKTDGTYILNNEVIYSKTYHYGTYKMVGNKITMDKEKIGKFPNFKHLELRNKQIGEGTTLYMYQNDSLEYQITVDNRRKLTFPNN